MTDGGFTYGLRPFDLSAVPSPRCFYPAAQTAMTDGGFTYGLRLFDLSAVPSPQCFYPAAQTAMTDGSLVYSLCFLGNRCGKIIYPHGYHRRLFLFFGAADRFLLSKQ